MGGKDVNKNSYDKKFVEFIDGYKKIRRIIDTSFY